MSGFKDKQVMHAHRLYAVFVSELITVVVWGNRYATAYGTQRRFDVAV